MIISIIVLFFQAVFLAHGGITTIGANTISMGVVGTFAGYGLWKLFRYFKVPGLIVDLAEMVYRYITLMDQAALPIP